MSWRQSPPDEALTTAQAFHHLTLETLRPLAELVHPDPPKKKGELVPLLSRIMADPERVRSFYDDLDPQQQDAVRMAAHHPTGQFDGEKFQAQYGKQPRFDTGDPNRGAWSYSYADRRNITPTPLRLFFPKLSFIPTDLRKLLLAFVPPPVSFMVPSHDAPPATVKLNRYVWTGKADRQEEWDEPVRIRQTASEAEADVRAVLRLIDANKVRVTDKKQMPTEATRRTVAGSLTGGDFYVLADADEGEYDPSSDLDLKAFAWPVLVLAGGLAEKKGDVLKLTDVGRRALTTSPEQVLDTLWARWQKTTKYDEFNRVEVIKGQGRTQLSAVANRRKVVAEALAECPAGRWVAVDDLFRMMRATGRQFVVAHETHELYISEHYYGNLGYSDPHEWEQLQGRFVLAFLFEYAATLGLIDVAYLPPQGIRHDFNDRWGADDLSCLSRYDGLLFFRVNPLGAWVLGKTTEYQPVAPAPSGLVKVLVNRDVVANGELPPSDRLALERFANASGERVWSLSAEKVLTVVEAGGSVDELEQFLTSRSDGPLPNTVVTFLNDLRNKVSRLSDAGPARLIACADEHVAAELAADKQLKGKCLRAGDRHIVVREKDLDAVRKAVRRLGYVWPIPAD